MEVPCLLKSTEKSRQSRTRTHWRQPPPTDKPRRVIERQNYFDIGHYTEEMVRNSVAGYYGFVSYSDDCVGRVLRQLDAQGLRDNTLIVYASDHGENLYHHGLCEKHTFYDDAVRVPLILSCPGVLPVGQRTQFLASIMDILPTALAINDVPLPDSVEGVDLRPACNGQELHEHVFAEYYLSLDPSRMVRDQRWKYIYTEHDICELYDLANDPDETINLAWYPQYRERVEAMDRIVKDDWEMPKVPLWGTWNDLNMRKQRQRLAGVDIIDTRPRPDWLQEA